MDRRDPSGVTRARIALAVAGSDSGSGAGIQADLKTFAALGVYGATAITAVTAQNTIGVSAIHAMPPEIVRAQIDAVFKDFDVAAIKIGMLANAEIVSVVAEMLRSAIQRQKFVVCDPVMAASSGDALAGAGFAGALRTGLLPLVDCLTPNLAEAAALLEEPVAESEADMARQGHALAALGPRAVLMKGGHLDGPESVDLLVAADGVRRYAARRLQARNLHGTGCTLSSAIAAQIVLGRSLPDAVAAAKAFVVEAIEAADGTTLGAGVGPILQMRLRAP
jgi:hydroxymethylpyrimidine/phosphomethylpyrimidine kinase